MQKARKAGVTGLSEMLNVGVVGMRGTNWRRHAWSRQWPPSHPVGPSLEPGCQII